MVSIRNEEIKRWQFRTCLRASRIEQTQFGLRCASVAMIVGLGAAQVLASPASPATAKHYNSSAIPKAETNRVAGGNNVPEGLSTSDWSSIRAAYQARRLAASAVDGGYQTHNPGQRWRTRFDGRGFLTAPDAGGWSWGLKLLSYGRPGAEQVVTAASRVETDGGRVSYAWDDTLTEWYVNDRRGLEHGYTIQRRPAYLGSEGSMTLAVRNNPPVRSLTVAARNDAPDRSLIVAARKDTGSETHTGDTPVPFLQLTLAVRGDLRPRVSADGRNVTFVNDAGAAVVNYHGLSVVDAGGAVLPARFTASIGASSEKLVLNVDDRGARYPLTIDPIAQQAYLKASNTDSGDQFGVSVAVSGDTVVVGALGEGSSATGVDGDQADNSATDAGAAYVFVRDAFGVWSQQAYLKASNTDSFDNFGNSVAVSGDTVVVGAVGEDSSATGVDGNQADNSAGNAGAAYVFVRDAGGVWSQQVYLKASNTDGVDLFAVSVAVSGGTVVVGAELEGSSATGIGGNQADNSTLSAGAAYVFVRDAGGAWNQQAYLKASNTNSGDLFGQSVALSGDTVMVVAPGEGSSATGVNGNQADNSAARAGAAYVFVRDAFGVWSQQAYLKASNTDGDDQFGASVAVSGDTVVIGALGESSSATGIDGNQGDNSTPFAGAAYVFVRGAGGVWNQQTYLKASNADSVDEFGLSVAVSGDTVVVGALGESSSATGIDGNQADNSASGAGAAYVFVRGGGVWSQQAYLKASNTDSSDRFGRSVAVSGDTVVVGAGGESSSATGIDGDQADNSLFRAGAAYVFSFVCGDGILDPGEACDNGVANSDTVPDACRTDCTLPTCGDDVVDMGEECDGSASAACPGPCRSDCTCTFDPPVAGVNTFDRALEIILPTSGAGTNTAYRVTLVTLYAPGNPQPQNQPDFSAIQGEVRYLNLLRDSGGNVVTDCVSSAAFGTTYPCISVGCNPEFADWGTLFGGVTAYVSGNAIIPDSIYTVAHLASTCVGMAATCTSASAEVPITTARYGDTQPDGTVNVTDVVNTVDVVKQVFGALLKYHVYVRATCPAPQNDAVNVTDIVLHVDALKLEAYQLPITCVCP